MKKIEDRIAREVCSVSVGCKMKCEDEAKVGVTNCLISHNRAGRIFTLIHREYGTVKCGECLGTGHEKKGETSSPSDKQVHFTADADCPTCAGTGQRKLVARVECEQSMPSCLTKDNQCPLRKPLCVEILLYPIDFDEHPELRNKTFTVEVE